jgi:hypothetical protein
MVTVLKFSLLPLLNLSNFNVVIIDDFYRVYKQSNSFSFLALIFGTLIKNTSQSTQHMRAYVDVIRLIKTYKITKTPKPQNPIIYIGQVSIIGGL